MLHTLLCHSFAANVVRLRLHALAHNLANFSRTLALPNEAKFWSLTIPRDQLVRMGAKIVRHGRWKVFQMAEVKVPRGLFQQILDIATLPNDAYRLRWTVAAVARTGGDGAYEPLPLGAAITFETQDRHLVTAVHRWFGTQFSEHGADARSE